jgi:diadenosine tetraphosphate (Ap4A) HIT family hydrolase
LNRRSLASTRSSPCYLKNNRMPALASSVLSRLQADCWMCQGIYEPKNLVFYESRVSVAKLNPDQAFEGYSFLTLKWHEEELYRLADKDRKQFLEDMSLVASALSRAFKPDKMNYELLGNSMPHLHWHLVPRYTSDPMWGRPIWAGNRRRKRLNAEGYALLTGRVETAISTLKRGTPVRDKSSNNRPRRPVTLS